MGKRLSGASVLASALTIVSVLSVAPARADVFAWSYSGDGVSASGYLDATPIGGGAYDVTSISGFRNGVAITGLTDYAEPDNAVYASEPHVDYLGLAYTDANGDAFNVYYDTSTSDPYACGGGGYCEIGPGVPGTSGLGPPPDSIKAIDAFSLAAVPEPSTWAMFVLGFAGLGVAGLKRTRLFRA